MTSSTNSNQYGNIVITEDERFIEQNHNIIDPLFFEIGFLEPVENYNELSDPSSPDDKQSTHKKKAKNNSLICVVCGSSAFGRNFGAITCESCKLFFRRNARKNLATLRCRQNNTCEITFKTRRRCARCRLAKCLNNGMKRDRLLHAEEKAEHRKAIENQNLILQTNNDINEQRSHLQLTTCPDHLLTQRDTKHYSTNSTEFLSQSSFQLQQGILTSEDLQSIENVQIAFNKRIDLATHDGLPWNPSTSTNTLLEHLNARSVSAMRLLAFFKQIPEFNQLNVDDKIILVKYNLMSVIILNYALSFRCDSQKIFETDSDMPWNSTILRTVHGNELFTRVKKIFHLFVDIKEYDQQIIQLLLIVLLLTKGLSASDDISEPILNDNMTVYRAQKYYTELLWKYIETVHGFGQAFHIFNKLITGFLRWQTLQIKLQYNVQQNLLITGENELLPLMKTLLHIS